MRDEYYLPFGRVDWNGIRVLGDHQPVHVPPGLDEGQPGLEDDAEAEVMTNVRRALQEC